jgi:hypothetical protein
MKKDQAERLSGLVLEKRLIMFELEKIDKKFLI